VARGRRSKKDKYRSGFERTIAAQLTKAGVKFKYEAKRITYTKKTGVYIPDFVMPSGALIETKGRLSSADRTKHKLLHEQRPDLDVRFIFQRDQRLSKASDTLYSEWCDKHGFKYAVGTIPQSWIDEK
jgi:hypothetical protein